MGEKALKNIAAFTFILMLSVMILSIFISGRQRVYNPNSAFAEMKATFYEHKNKSKDYLSTAEELKGELGEKYIIIKNAGNNSTYTINENYMKKEITLTIKGLNEQNLTEDEIVRVNQGQTYKGAVSGENTEQGGYLVPEVLSASGETSYYGRVPEALKADPVNDFTISYEMLNEKEYEAEIHFTLDHVYAPVLFEEDGQIYVALKEPSKAYDNIVVLDAGHGGKDPGAEAIDGSCYEKSINLKILLDLKEILDGENIKVYYTRTGDETVYLNPRVNLANETKADLFLSIHCNSSESSQPRGIEVLYKSDWNQGSFTSEKLASIALDEMKNISGHINRGLVAGDEMLIIHKSQVPVALIEVGFLSNEEELSFLKSRDSEKDIAQAISVVIKKALEEKKNAGD
ncbi:N-acetylmuramoyl-L-alanine amidase [Anaerocolumna xylanovorans]|uniref:N-acetylmuramoyl-L-alanine amidase n=1 Tax=Anaerocolumna xylanovorans DSM 12503 TaxID=1121345 RepID=A0A1M7YNA5_9FIRM|nr:N-acetylmuramoyl-L-alanine amidase [Anaerocolumna xylanovorans]SHO54124.1 N-acetylmuramoyl-L-alanine amidase [Anaerocolumna xylanovorans DSM 12503]